jgi:acetyltransferase
VGPSDSGLLLELFNTLGSETIYNRFLTPLTRLTADQLRRMTCIDPEVECALATVVADGGRERFTGIGRFRLEDDDSAELAIVIGDPWQRRGHGRMLLARMTGIARDMGLRWFISTIDPGNMKLLRFAEACGFKGRLQYKDGLLRMRTDVMALFPETPGDPIGGHPVV